MKCLRSCLPATEKLAALTVDMPVLGRMKGSTKSFNTATFHTHALQTISMMVLRSPIPVPISVTLKTATDKSTTNDTATSWSDAARIFLQKGTPIDAYLTIGGCYIEPPLDKAALFSPRLTLLLAYRTSLNQVGAF